MVCLAFTHSAAGFMHVAIHKEMPVACRSWLRLQYLVYQAAVPELAVSCPCVREGCFGYKVGAEKRLGEQAREGF